MSEIYTGILNKCEVAHTAQEKGGKEYRQITVDKEYFSLFKSEEIACADEIILGTRVNVQYVRKGNYKNAEGIEVAASAPTSPPASVAREPSTNASIENQVCLKCAVEVEIAVGVVSAQKVLNTASLFQLWIQGRIVTPQQIEPAMPKPDTNPTTTQAGKPSKPDFELFWTTMSNEGIDKGKLARILSQVEGSPVKDLQEYLKTHTLDQVYKTVSTWLDAQAAVGDKQAEFQDDVPF